MAQLSYKIEQQETKIKDLSDRYEGHEKRITTLETQKMAIAPQSAVTPNITVKVPDNIATKADINGMTKAAIRASMESIVEAARKFITEVSGMTSQQSARSNQSKATVDEYTLKQVARDAAKEALDAKYSDVEFAADKLNNRVNGILNGIIWASIPKWFYALFVIFMLSTIGFGYGFFKMSEQNTKLKDVEWLYRRERALYDDGKPRDNMVLREREFLLGTPHERDSIKDWIRSYEQYRNIDKTLLYFNPTEK